MPNVFFFSLSAKAQCFLYLDTPHKLDNISCLLFPSSSRPCVDQPLQVDTVRCVISVKGMDELLGVMPTSEALARAKQEGLDLVMISPDADPPVVKIIDYGKFK